MTNGGLPRIVKPRLIVEKVVKIVVAVFVLIILVVIGIMTTLPKDRLTFEEEMNVRDAVKELNYDLPRNIGTIGTLDSITYHKRNICYNLTVYGDASIYDFYRAHYQDYHNVFLYGFATLNGQNGNGTTLAEYYKVKKIGTSATVYFPNHQSLTWDFSPSEPLEFIQSYYGTPTDALGRVLDFHIALANYNCYSITTNSISQLSDEGIALNSVEHIDNDVVWNWDVDENLYDVKILSANLQRDDSAELFIEEYAEDPDFQELINLISIAHANIVIRYRGMTNGQVAEIQIPYSLIKQYSQVPHLH